MSQPIYVTVASYGAQPWQLVYWNSRGRPQGWNVGQHLFGGAVLFNPSLATVRMARAPHP